MAELREGQRLKYTVTHYRQPHFTHEEFMKWMVKEHLPLATPVFKKHGVISYTLFDTPSSLNEPLKEYLMPDQQAMANMLADPEWHASVKDQEKFVDTSKALLSVGYAIPYLTESGEVLNLPNAAVN
ncbi:conserved hypothetical protein [Talaromyces stipitatus ATCC 10500]|uniref:EthD domain-containing protein n=1 Tax=Talaromyces stipitatus (strain ATCC 10500 / CBS 375.48 / QM 6759 / NRRL 1006) TaxID=441959 RepID=B8MAH3_TALSN|nr:uncharacterized protein TSTA_112300 [Talaromyces stipitatus ATCC 10500]EED17397.1 conserved hypothetical protein [Talaromyces stipitatus ATCC 10500]